MPDIGKLLWPRSVAVIGASSDTERLRGRILQVMKGHPFQGPIYPVCRGEDEVQGLKAYRSVAELPAPPDLAVLIIPAKFVPEELARCGAAGIPAATILSSGFAEEPGEVGRRLQDEDPRHCAAPRHGGERAQRRGLCQHRGGALPDLQPGHGSRRRAVPSPRRQHARSSGGHLAKRRHGLCVLRPRPSEKPVLPLHRDHRQRGLPRDLRLRRLHARRRQDRRLPAAARGREEFRDLRAGGGEGAARRQAADRQQARALAGRQPRGALAYRFARRLPRRLSRHVRALRGDRVAATSTR